MVPEGVVPGPATLVDTSTSAGCVRKDCHMEWYEATDAAISVPRRLERGATADGWNEDKDGMREEDMSCDGLVSIVEINTPSKGMCAQHPILR